VKEKERRLTIPMIKIKKDEKGSDVTPFSLCSKSVFQEKERYSSESMRDISISLFTKDRGKKSWAMRWIAVSATQFLSEKVVEKKHKESMFFYFKRLPKSQEIKKDTN